MTLTPHPLLVPWSRKGTAIPVLPLWAVQPVQSLSACTRVHFTLPVPLCRLFTVTVSNDPLLRSRFLVLSLNVLNPELNPICYLLALLAHHFLHVSRIRVKSLPLRFLMSYIYIYMEHLFLMFLDHIRRRSTVGMTPLDE